MNLSKSLKIALVKADKSQAQLADDLGVKRQVVNRWANTGNMTKETLETLADYFDMKPSEFVALGE